MDDRTAIAMTVAAALAQRDDKPCRRKSNIVEAIAYADEMLRRLQEPTYERVHGDIGGAAGREETAGGGHPIGMRDLGA